VHFNIFKRVDENLIGGKYYSQLRVIYWNRDTRQNSGKLKLQVFNVEF